MGDDKSEKNEVMWYDVYHELAKLLAKIDGKKLYEKCKNNEKFQNEYKWFNSFTEETQKDENKKRKLDREIIKSLDPMHVFASFNGFRMSPKSRTDRINSYFNLLGAKSIDKEINFTGCPSPIMIKLIAVREEKHQEPIWEYFKKAINHSEKKLDDDFINFDKLKECYGITIESFTVLLFWIDSKNFLPLDKNTIALFETNNQEIKVSDNKSSKENKQIITISEWKDYINFLNRNTTSSDEIYRVIARMAWKCTDELSKYEKELKQFEITKCPNKSLKIIAINPLGGCNPKFLKGLKENQIYLFDKAYTITIDDKMEIKKVEYNKEKDIQLFNQDNLQININAIVGKNGTGKSTLIELLLAVINNIIFQTYECKEKSKVKIIEITGLKIELIFEDLHIYKVKINDKKIELFKYDNLKWIEIKKLKNKQFFYNILVNYSIHSLDSSENNWIDPHFDNDCYTDIVIEPFREKGNINIQEEEKRVKERLIVNLLEPKSEDDEYSFRQITDKLEAVSFMTSRNSTEYEQYRKNSFNIDEISKHIQEKIKKNIKENKQNTTIQTVMPKNLFSDIVLRNGVNFSKLSSGEKQKIYSINSIIYHIQEIDRKKKHQHINLVLDEIELYFHPELQRTYINDIIEAIKKIDPKNILGINITFITHSPFILSDIPESKILFLDKESDDADAKTVPQDNGIQTFGANIHTLLSDSFFMDKGLIGEFAKNKIQDIIDFFNEKKTMKEISMEKEQILKTIESIGEPFLKSKLLDMYNREFFDDYKRREQKRIDEQIRVLQEKREQLDD